MDRCQDCGAPGYGTGVCGSCSWARSMNAMVQDAAKMSTDLNYGIYHDRGCCGCNTRRRRLVMLAWGVGILIAGLCMGPKEYGLPAFLGCLMFVAIAVFCPNGPCGMYSSTGDMGCLKREDLDCLKPQADPEAGAALLSSQSGQQPPAATTAAPGAGAVGQDPASQANVASVLRYQYVYNNPNEQEMQYFVATCYADQYQSVAMRDTIRHKPDMPNVFHEAWQGQRRLENFTINGATPQLVAYSYTMTFAGKFPPLNINAVAVFGPPGVFQSATFTKRQ